MNIKYIKSLDFEKLKQTFNFEFDKKFWNIVRANIDNIEEANDWFGILSNDLKLSEKIKLGKGLKKIIIDYLPNEIDHITWSDWTKKILEKCDIKPKELYTKLRIILTGKKFGPSMNDLLTLLKVSRKLLKGLMLIVKNDTVKLYDSTLRDGAQTKGVNFSFTDKLKILEILP